jgi:hypothetical protein
MPLPSGRDPHVVSTGLFTKTVYTVATLPPVAENQGTIRWVSDLANNPASNSGQVATGGGTTQGRVASDGTNWRIYGWTP